MRVRVERHREARRRAAVTALAAVGGLLAALLVAPGASPAASAAHRTSPGRAGVHLVTLDGPGTAGYRGPMSRAGYRVLLTVLQDQALARVGAEPLYRWTTALNGFAAELTAAQVEQLRSDPEVALVEPDEVRPLASSGTRRTAGLPGTPSQRGGAGQVIGLVDTGIWPDSPLFASEPGLGRSPERFRGGCPDAADLCTDKIVGARWFVEGFGADRVRSTSSLSPRDDQGHGTQMASIAAGNAGVSVEVPGQRMGQYGGVAPQARIAAYKACWTAPDPADDGCATTDLVTAVDRATADRVDVLNLSVSGGDAEDTLERALLGAAESGVVVVAAAGNRGRAGYAAHASPWVTTVGATSGPQPSGRLLLAGGPALTGAMAAGRGPVDARVVSGADAAADGVARLAARQCRPDSLDASRTRGAVVVCERGGVARVAKSDAVQQADGAGMVLLNTGPGRVAADLHRVPTIHLDVAGARAARAWLRDHPRARATLRPLPAADVAPRVPSWSEPGDPTSPVLKPDVVAEGAGVLGAVPPQVRGLSWDFATGTSAASALTSGLAARLLARHDWSAAVVRSALATTATRVAASPSPLRSGAGVPDAAAADRPGLGFPVRPGAYRAWLDGEAGVAVLNSPSLLLAGGSGRVTRRLVNLGSRTATWTVAATGLDRHVVTVSPPTFTLRPGERVRVAIRVARPGPPGPLDDGALTWTGTDGTVVRFPLALAR